MLDISGFLFVSLFVCVFFVFLERERGGGERVCGVTIYTSKLCRNTLDALTEMKQKRENPFPPLGFSDNINGKRLMIDAKSARNEMDKWNHAFNKILPPVVTAIKHKIGNLK